MEQAGCQVGNVGDAEVASLTAGTLVCQCETLGSLCGQEEVAASDVLCGIVAADVCIWFIHSVRVRWFECHVNIFLHRFGMVEEPAAMNSTVVVPRIIHQTWKTAQVPKIWHHARQ